MSTSHQNINDNGQKSINNTNITNIITNNINKYIPDLKRSYKVIQDEKDIFSGKFSPESKLSEVRKDLELSIGDKSFFFLDNQSIPILKENELEFKLTEISTKNEIVNISTEVCSPDLKKLTILSIFAFIFFILISIAIYNPEHFTKVYISCIVLALSFSK